MSLFAILLLLVAIGILIVLAARLLGSYPVVFFGLLFILVSSVLALIEGLYLLGVLWLIFSFTVAIAGAIHFYKNVRGAFWWAFGALLGILAVGILNPDASCDLMGMLESGELDLPSLLVNVGIPVGIFLVIGLLGSIFMPRLIHKNKDQRKHRTNIDPIIGKRVTITVEATEDHPQRGLIGDVDWAIQPLFSYESFKVGDVVKVHRIKGVTLLCTRDGKDYRKEQRNKRKEERAKAKAEREARKAKKEAPKAKEQPKVEVVKPVEEPKVVEKPAPVVEEPKPVVEEPKPVVEEPKPVIEEPAPVVEEPAPKKQKPEFIPFAVRLSQSDDFAKAAYNELKSEVLSYGIKSRVSSTGDTFRLHKKEYVKMVVAGKFLKLYLALNPDDYKDTTYPYEDAGRMGAHENTPFVFKIKSGLSIRRAKVLIADAAKKDELVQGEVVQHDHFKDLQ